MKKILAILLVLSMLFCMVACGDAHEEDEKDEGAEQTFKSDDPADLSPESETEELTTEASTEESAEDATESGGLLQGIVGNYNGNYYENEFLGISCELSSEWVVKSEEEIAQLFGMTRDLLDDSAISEMIETSGSACVYMASNANGESVNIILENTASYGFVLDAEAYIEAAWSTMESALISAGYENLKLEKVSVEFAGEKRFAIAIDADFYGVKIYEVIVPLVYDTCIAAITVATANNNNCDAILACFEAITN